jgi:uncharacterized protein
MIAENYVAAVLRESNTLNELQSRIHGLDHWWRVWKNAQWLYNNKSTVKIAIDMEVVALFALFHDSMRENDNRDPDHGVRGWLLWKYLYDGSGDILTEEQDQRLATACADHDKGLTHPDATIGTCWDADRLDLHRVGIWPDPRFMSTGVAKMLTLGRVRPGEKPPYLLGE